MIIGLLSWPFLGLPEVRHRMKSHRIASLVMSGLLVAALGRHATASFGIQANQPKGKAAEIPMFEYDPSWPKPLPNNWITGNIGGMFIDS